MTPLLEIRDISFAYEGSPHPLFKHLDLVVEAGEFIIVKGPSGTGKSTLLRLICRLSQPGEGAIFFRGRNVREMAPSLLRSLIGYVAQVPQMIDASVGDNLLLPFSFAVNRKKRVPGDAELRQMLDEFYLGGITLQQSAQRLSTGQKQRLAIMRAILQQPELLLLDEPTSSLDNESASMVFSIMEFLNTSKKMALITVTHSDYAPAVQTVVFRLENHTLQLTS
jgi:putative ABC transport system ATP-binding protein